MSLNHHATGVLSKAIAEARQGRRKRLPQIGRPRGETALAGEPNDDLVAVFLHFSKTCCNFLRQVGTKAVVFGHARTISAPRLSSARVGARLISLRLICQMYADLGAERG